MINSLASTTDSSVYLKELSYLVNQLEPNERGLIRAKVEEVANKSINFEQTFAETLYWIHCSLLKTPNQGISDLFFSQFPTSPIAAIIPINLIPEEMRVCTTIEQAHKRIIILSHLRIGYCAAFQKDIENNQVDVDSLHRYLWSLSSRINDKAVFNLLNIPDYSELFSNLDIMWNALFMGIRAYLIIGPLPALAVAGTTGLANKAISVLSHPQNIDHTAHSKMIEWYPLSSKGEIEYGFEPRSSGTRRFVSSAPSRTVGRIRIPIGDKHLYQNFNLDDSSPLSIYAINELGNALREAIFTSHQLKPKRCLKILNALEKSAIKPKNVTLLNKIALGCILDLKNRCILQIMINRIGLFEALKLQYPPNSFGARFWHHLTELKTIQEKVENKHEAIFSYARRLFHAIYQNNSQLIFLHYRDVASCKRAISIEIHPDKIVGAEFKKEATLLFAIYSNVFIETEFTSPQEDQRHLQVTWNDCGFDYL